MEEVKSEVPLAQQQQSGPQPSGQSQEQSASQNKSVEPIQEAMNEQQVGITEFMCKGE